MNKIVLGVIAIIIIGGGIAFAASQKNEASESEAMMHQDEMNKMSGDAMMHDGTTTDAMMKDSGDAMMKDKGAAMMHDGSTTDSMMAH